jgi:hypothetical protein
MTLYQIVGLVGKRKCAVSIAWINFRAPDLKRKNSLEHTFMKDLQDF